MPRTSFFVIVCRASATPTFWTGKRFVVDEEQAKPYQKRSAAIRAIKAVYAKLPEIDRLEVEYRNGISTGPAPQVQEVPPVDTVKRSFLPPRETATVAATDHNKQITSIVSETLFYYVTDIGGGRYTMRMHIDNVAAEIATKIQAALYESKKA